MHHLRILAVHLLASSLFLALAAPALADNSAYGPVDTGSALLSPGKDTADSGTALLSAGKDAAGIAPVDAAPVSIAAAPGRAGGLHPGMAAAALSGLGLLVIGGGLAVSRRRF